MKLYYDKANSPIQHDRSEHVEVDRYFNKEKLDSGLVCTPYISLERQLADILTYNPTIPIYHKQVQDDKHLLINYFRVSVEESIQ